MIGVPDSLYIDTVCRWTPDCGDPRSEYCEQIQNRGTEKT